MFEPGDNKRKKTNRVETAGLDRASRKFHQLGCAVAVAGREPIVNVVGQQYIAKLACPGDGVIDLMNKDD